MSWKVYVNTAGDPPDVFTPNGIAWYTKVEAERAAFDLMCRWTAVRTYEVRESDEPVNRAHWVCGDTIIEARIGMPEPSPAERVIAKVLYGV